MADAHFVTSNYNAAITAYDNAIKVGKIEADYAFFQKAISYGYLGQASRKILELESFISSYNTSKLRDDAMYALGNAYVKAGNTTKAMSTYNTLTSEFKK